MWTRKSGEILLGSYMERIYSEHLRNIEAYIKGTVQDWEIKKTPS